MRVFGKTNIDFMVRRRAMYAVSAAVIAMGLGSVVFKGLHFGIDFKGGTELVVEFDQDVAIGEVRDAMESAGFARAEIKTFGADNLILIQMIEQAEGAVITERIRAGVSSHFPTIGHRVVKEDRIGPKIGAELRRDALYAVIAALVVILGYIALRFKFIYGLGAVAALFHDVLVTVGIMSILDGLFPFLNLEIDQNVIAAFLALVGLSVNDTVVIFDRIRENLKIYRSLTLIEVINRSVNDTLSRTLITSGTVFVVLVVLFLFGGEVTRGFAFAMTVGVITGTYSSIYIASAIVVDWSSRAKK